MSSILKALKRLEEEQSGRSSIPARQGGGQFVASMRATRPLLLLAGGVGAGLLLAGGLYAVFGLKSTPTEPPAIAARETRPPATGVETATTAVPVMPAVAPPPVSAPTAVKPVAAKPVAVSVAPAVIPAVIAGTERKPAVTLPLPPAADTKRPDPVQQVEIERLEIPAPGQQWSASHLVVSDILPAAGGGRMAIVNDLPVMEGTMVDDAVVREIRADSVIFTIDGKSITVPLAPGR